MMQHFREKCLRLKLMDTAQKMKFSIKDFFSKCGSTDSCGFSQIYWRNP